MIGACLTVLITRRLMSANPLRKRLQLMLSGLIAGATIWSTHFIAMLAYDPVIPHGYEPLLTGISLGIAVIGCTLANGIFAYASRQAHRVAGGVVFGLVISVMHYVGMLAYQIPGRIEWATEPVIASILLGSVLGAAAYHRMVYPVTRYCWLGATVLMVLAICAMHFTGMSAMTMRLIPGFEVPEQVLPDATMALLVSAVTIVIFFVGFAAISLEANVEREALEQLQHSAAHDQLTGLPNRAKLNTHLEDCDELLDRDETARAAALTIDLDMFKPINDLHGHSVGDLVLQETAARLSREIGPNEFIARTGGDEFVAIKTGFRRVEEVMAFAERLRAALIEPVETANGALVVGASIGVASSLSDGTDMAQLVQKSDMAMYRAKTSVERKVCRYNAAMDEQSRDKTMLINDLRQAIPRRQFHLVYQLQNDLTSLEPTGCEVLLRWTHPDRGNISPAEFIPLAEETGLVREIGLWVLREACHEAAGWDRPFSIAVNVAPQQLAQPSFIESLSDILMSSGLAPERLELEVTEASIIDDQAHTLKIMHRIKAMGVRIAMDDFGTGYSSLATLQSFPFDKIKIDRSFVQDVHLNHQRAAIVRSTLLLGNALGIPVLAEGVEQNDELEFLQAEQCAAVQGFLFGKPMLLDEIREIAMVIDADVA
ncbi:EAL domain-containing protein [Gymnodinialimonas sp. 2305UL16-5]|uniref:putative bifunctional diguanylate cyclase/phosphodiesterase n=1 Tax=Gymnodinialimonas mytili TaxID=3126503 RepID=UPI00309EBE5E